MTTITIRAKRDHGTWDPWRAIIKRTHLTACPEDANALFNGLSRKKECIFEIATDRPEGTDDYHKFVWNGFNYRTTNETTGPLMGITRNTSVALRRLTKVAPEIYVSVFA